MDDDVKALRRIAELLDEAPVIDPMYDEERRELVREIAGYLVPRLENPDAPLLIALCGSTGVGKSHVLNALTGSSHSPEGVLRPTTRHPVLCVAERGPGADLTAWDRRARIATSGLDVRTDASEVTACADLLDLPADQSHRGNGRLLDLADLVLVIASPARYADSGTWELVEERRRRAQPVWVVVNRATGPDDEVGADLKRRLKAVGLEVPVFLLPEGDSSFIDVLRARLSDAADPGRDALLGPALAARTDLVFARTANLAAPLDELRVRGERLKRLADAEYQTAATALAELIAENGLGAGAAAAAWPDVAERLAGVVTRRVGVAAERTASVWHTLDDGDTLLSGSGHELWRHPAGTAHEARSRLLEWEQQVASIVNRRSRRDLKPHKLSEVADVVRALALGGSPKIRWRGKRRLRDGLEPAAEEARKTLAELASGIVTDDEHRFLDRMGVRPSIDLVAELRDAASRTPAETPQPGLVVVPDPPVQGAVEGVALDA